MWKLSYEAPIGVRVNRYFTDVTIDFDDTNLETPWCYHSDGKWYKNADENAPKEGGCSTHSTTKVRTVKAFKRYLENHPELKGYRVRLCNKYYMPYEGETLSFDVIAEWKEN